MARIAGVDLPKNKPTWVALTYIYGIGKTTSMKIIGKAEVDGQKRVKDLSGEEVNRIRQIIEKQTKVEGTLRRETQGNVRRLIEIGSYRGIRHTRGLPLRGQRTRHNARTRKGRRKTVAVKKKASRLGVKGG